MKDHKRDRCEQPIASAALLSVDGYPAVRLYAKKGANFAFWFPWRAKMMHCGTSRDCLDSTAVGSCKRGFSPLPASLTETLAQATHAL